MLLMIAVGWVLMVLVRSSWPARGQLLGFFSELYVDAEYLSCSTVTVLPMFVMPAIIVHDSEESGVAASPRRRGAMRAAEALAEDAGPFAEATRLDCTAPSLLASVAGRTELVLLVPSVRRNLGHPLLGQDLAAAEGE
jgi:hypothetical protein